MNVVIIGAGNVGTNLAYALSKQNNIVQIISKTQNSARILAEKINTEYTSDLKNISNIADIYIVAVNDGSIVKLVKQINVENKIIVHTAGSVNIDALKNSGNNYGIFYPLQTFSKHKILEFDNIPICVEANNYETEKSIQELAKSISNKVYLINSEQRKYLHLSAVFACNFTNHLYNISKKILKEKNLDFEIIKPLIEETAKKIKNTEPADAQTGPAARNDKIIIEKHLELLSLYPEFQNIYNILTKSIIEKHLKNE